jgi:hypothetical protein
MSIAATPACSDAVVSLVATAHPTVNIEIRKNSRDMTEIYGSLFI